MVGIFLAERDGMRSLEIFQSSVEHNEYASTGIRSAREKPLVLRPLMDFWALVLSPLATRKEKSRAWCSDRWAGDREPGAGAQTAGARGREPSALVLRPLAQKGKKCHWCSDRW